MDNIDIQKLRDLPIEAVAERLGLSVTRHRSICPFHQDSHPSLTFNVSKNRYRCYACGAYGNTIDLAMHMLGKRFPDACQWLANEHNVIITQYKPVQKTPDMNTIVTFDREICEFMLRQSRYGFYTSMFLFEQRHLDPDVIRQLHIGAIDDSGYWYLRYNLSSFSDDRLRKAGLLVGTSPNEHFYFCTPCLLLPYFDIDGRLVAIQSRYVGNLIRFLTPEAQARHEEQVKRIPRFQFLRGSHPGIFNLPVLRTLQPGDELWITEGVTDCLAMLSSGRKAIAIPSATLLTCYNKQLLETWLLKHGTTVTLHIYPDQDDAGERLYNELLLFSLSAGLTLVRHSLPEGYKDFGDYYASETKKP